MRAFVAKFLPASRNFFHQIVPPVLATLIAALLIAGFNRAFSGHLVQPRMAALHSSTGETTRPVVYAPNPHEEAAVAEAAASEPTVSERVFAKDDAREAGKDQGSLKVAAAAPAATAAPAPATPRVASRKAEPQVFERPVIERQLIERQVIEQREPRVAAVPMVVPPAPAIVAPAPVIAAPPVVAQPLAPMVQPVAPMQPAASAPPPVAQEPPPVITAKPMVTVPDRPRPAYPGYQPRPPYEQQQAEQDIAPPHEPRPLERFVDSLKPSSIFNRMREFGDRIEAAGNEILPSIRQ